jgi:NADPH-dependent curcumin reductase CurA
MTGLTAYVGLKRMAELKEGERVLVSAASGAVGSVVCQIAKIMGCTVVGTASSDEKCAWLLNELKIDRAINYKKTPDLAKAFSEALPEGINVYFENVGDAFLEAAIDNMSDFGRIVLCGMIALYNLEKAKPGPSNLFLAITKRLKLHGFIVSDNLDMREAFITDMTLWIQEGRIVWKDTIFEGIENASMAFLGLFAGENIGKMLVKLT